MERHVSWTCSVVLPVAILIRHVTTHVSHDDVTLWSGYMLDLCLLMVIIRTRRPSRGAATAPFGRAIGERTHGESTIRCDERLEDALFFRFIRRCLIKYNWRSHSAFIVMKPVIDIHVHVGIIHVHVYEPCAIVYMNMFTRMTQQYLYSCVSSKSMTNE